MNDADRIASALARLRGGMRPPFGPGMMPPHGGANGGPHGRGGRGMALIRLLDALAEADEPVSVSVLAERIGVDQPRASRLVQGAVHAGFARREADPDDARRTLIVLTREGRAMAERMRGSRTDAVAEALEGFTDAERAQLAELLSRLADAWPHRPGPWGPPR